MKAHLFSVKTIALLFILSSCSLLKAEDALKNPDFVDGLSHWDGPSESLSTTANDSDGQPLGSSPAPGLVVKLDDRRWVCLSQDFRPLAPSGVLTITFRCSDDLAFTQDRGEYKNIPQKIGYTAFKRFRIPDGDFLTGLVETAKLKFEYYPTKPASGTDVQTVKTPVGGLVVRVDKVLCLAFPPGHGKVTLLHVGIADQ